jgi:ATP-dependent helicase/nuclease subunit B
MTAPDTGTELTIVCETDRLARELRARHNESRRDAGDQVWNKPSIFSLRGWLDFLWTASWPTLVVATPAQELALWFEVIEASGAAAQVISPMGVARQARQAYALARTYRLDTSDVWGLGVSEHQAFAGWRQAFDERCRAAGLLPRAALMDSLAETIGSGGLVVAGPVRLEGWSELPPQLARLVEALQAQSVPIEISQPGGGATEPSTLWRPLNPTEEARLVAGRVRGLLKASNEEGTDAPRIGIFVADAEKARAAVESALREALCPDRADGVISQAEAWRFVRGQPLFLHPLVSAAVDALNLDRFDNELALISRILLSPFIWGGNGEERGRGIVDLGLRERGGRRYPLASITKLAKKGDRPVGDTAARLEALAFELETRHGMATPTGWKERFEARLAILGFPGRRSESSSRFQAFNAFKKCLAELATLDAIAPELTEAEARHWLREIVVARPFEARIEQEQPIHILPFEDVTGLRFDHVFVLGVTAGVLPRPRTVSAFLDSAELERCAPEATAAGRLEEAKRLVSMLGVAAPRVTWCCPIYDDQGALCMPSALIGPWPDGVDVLAGDRSLLQEVMGGGVEASMPAADPVPAVADAAAEGVRGGVSILSNFATSPFVAYCRSRLGLEAFPDEVGGLDARVQGNLIHAALARFWTEAKTSTKLHALIADPQLLDQMLENCVRAAAEDDGHLPELVFGRVLVRMEKARLVAVLREWLKHEARRAHPFEVVCVERETRIEIEGLPQKLRLDRVDRIMVGDALRHVVIDYKSGFWLPSTGWSPDALTEPQLPIYAAYGNLSEIGVPSIDGIALAQVAEGKYGFRMWSNFAGRLVLDERGTLGKAVQDWEALREGWRSWLAGAARGFLAGDAWLDEGALAGSPFLEDLRPFDRRNSQNGPTQPTEAL